MRLEMGEPALRMEQKGRTILLADDEPLIRDICARSLDGYEVLQAGDGMNALDLLHTEEVDLVLTDVMMPRLNGLDLLRQVKDHDPNLPVVVMTGFSDKEIILRALRDGADDFISKPINLLQLRTTIDKVFERKALQEELFHLKRMDSLKSEFLGLISHKLKTPITAISLFIQNLAQGIGSPDEPAFRETLDLILNESRHLEGLIQDLLQYSKVILQNGPSQTVAGDLEEILTSACRDKRELARAKGILLSHEPKTEMPKIPLDPQRIGFAVRALLDNSIKFTPPGGRVDLATEQEDTHVRISIRDTGPGIEPKELPKIFEKFYQIDPDRTGQVRGFGLGLFYARQFILDQGGRIEVESEPGEGSTFSLILSRG